MAGQGRGTTVMKYATTNAANAAPTRGAEGDAERARRQWSTSGRKSPIMNAPPNRSGTHHAMRQTIGFGYEVAPKCVWIPSSAAPSVAPSAPMTTAPRTQCAAGAGESARMACSFDRRRAHGDHAFTSPSGASVGGHGG